MFCIWIYDNYDGDFLLQILQNTKQVVVSTRAKVFKK